jgi:Ala-tRNA(Pro) deacylase
MPEQTPHDASTYDRLIALLDRHNAQYRIIDHPAEGHTELVSPMRGNELGKAAKCIILLVKLGRKTSKHILSVIPGNRKLDLSAVKTLFSATYVGFASTVAERLTGSVTGTVLPISFNAELELIADRSLVEVDELFFNAARLDRSVALRTRDYLQIARPRIEEIATGCTKVWFSEF